MTGRIFFNYRRSLGSAEAQQLYAQLEHRFGKDRLFLDLGKRQGVCQWIEELEQADGGDVMLVLIPPQWEDVFDDDEFHAKCPALEREIRLAVKRNVHLLPVLLDRKEAPDFALLPRPYNRMADAPPVKFRRGRNLRDGEIVGDVVQAMLPAPERLEWWKFAAAALVVFALGALWGASGDARHVAYRVQAAQFERLSTEVSELRERAEVRKARAAELELELAALRAQLEAVDIESSAAVEAATKAAAAVLSQPAGTAPAERSAVETAAAQGAAQKAETSATKPTEPIENAPPPVERPALSRFVDCQGCPEMRVLPTGAFSMGSETGDADETPVRTVEIGEIAISETEVTVGQFRAFVEATDRAYDGACSTYEARKWARRAGRSWRAPGFDQTDAHPVVCVSWDDAAAYAAWLSEKTGRSYRLPTEAEWEYAARSGGARRFSFGDEIADAAQAVWYDENSARRTHPVGSKSISDWGLRHMSGNAWEWAGECWRGSLAPDQREDCSAAAIRGGSWATTLRKLRVSERFRFSRELRSSAVGFRVAQDL